MTEEPLTAIFADAAVPQKVVFLILIAAFSMTLVGIILGLRRRTLHTAWRRGMVELRCVGPLLGLLTAGLNGLHMAHTIQRLPTTLKDLAPGMLEVSALLSLGALVGLGAAVACLFLDASHRATRSRQGLP